MVKIDKKFIFLGTPEFAVIILKKMIAADLIPAAVITNPDRPTGRHKILTPTPVKLLAQEKKIEILTPENLKDADFRKEIINLGADFFILAAYGKILPNWLIKMTPNGVVGVHPSLLPKYRGATPIQSSILNGDLATGASLFIIDGKIDHGPILAKKRVGIEDKDNYVSLIKKLAEASGNLLIKNLPLYLNGHLKPKPQNHNQATFTNKIKTADAFIEWSDIEKAWASPQIARQIWLKIRALNPEPGVFTIKNNKRIKLLQADFSNKKLIIRKIQFAGGKPQNLIKT